ncbi:YciE/YciF ferroxidase family protein [Puniceicoccus vermicola]|uniref:Ferritin-like domain-containing protein n=1 Tax=Puniceicoccus vermicola TaxID=388746 RepID=A0A7X1AUH0_9BACT|nr:DUF892 family protein [Puniceicoccus vermicola]MBC2600250.1 ferritin-like domain-containing protein [Puniceicoccus vermicola]
MKHTFKELYLAQLQDLYSAETQLIDALPKLAWRARDEDLKKSFGEHLEETKEHVARLEKIFEGHSGAKPGGHDCEAMKGLLREGEEALQEEGKDVDGKSGIMDAHLIASAYRVEHYEIAAYKIAISMARALDEKADANLLSDTLKDEKEAANLLEKMVDGTVFTSGLHEEIANG